MQRGIFKDFKGDVMKNFLYLNVILLILLFGHCFVDFYLVIFTKPTDHEPIFIFTQVFTLVNLFFVAEIMKRLNRDRLEDKQ